MQSQKLENLLQLSLSVSNQQYFEQSGLSVGFDESGKTWELIVKYHGNLSQYTTSDIIIEELLAGYALVQLPARLIDAFSELEEVEYIEKPKLLFFETTRRLTSV